MPNLTTNQTALLTECAIAHRHFRVSAKVSTGIKYQGHHPAVLKSLLSRGLVRDLQPDIDGWVNPANGRYDPRTHEVELTRSGWDYLWGFKRQPQ